MLRDLSVAKKLTLTYGLLFVPIVYLAWSLITEKQISIDFASKEVIGVQYLTETAATHHALSALRSGGRDTASADAALRGLQTIDQRFGGDLDTKTPYEEFQKAWGLARQNPAKLPDAVAKLRALIARVGDGSNLILDPDLDSFYVMDLVLVKSPALLDRIVGVAEVAVKIAAAPTITMDDRTEYLIERGGLDALIDDIAASVAAGYRGNADGSLKASMTAPYQKLSNSLKTFITQVDGIVKEDKRVAPAGAETHRLKAQTLAALNEMTALSSSELNRLLVQRIDGFQRNRLTSLSITVLLMLLAMVALVAVQRSITRPIKLMDDVIEQARATERYNQELDWKSGDEIGRLVAALNELFRKSEGARLRERIETHRLEEEAARSVSIADATKEFESSV
jgi:methyl-accepting chemotaxis protein